MLQGDTITIFYVTESDKGRPLWNFIAAIVSFIVTSVDGHRFKSYRNYHVWR